MKKPWFTFAGICSLVFGIVIFCVIFGGYSSLLRAQSRINKAKLQLADQSGLMLDRVKELVSLADPGDEIGRSLTDTAQTADKIVHQVRSSGDPIDPGLLKNFEIIYQQLNQKIPAVTDRIKMAGKHPSDQMDRMTESMNESQAAVFITAKRYNKQATYFNTRTKVFPGFIIARIFNLDKLHFQEIAVEHLAHKTMLEAAGET